MTEYQDLLKNLEHEEIREIMEYIQAVHTQLPVIALGLPHTLKSSVVIVCYLNTCHCEISMVFL